jgi:hypothetical protein
MTTLTISNYNRSQHVKVIKTSLHSTKYMTVKLLQIIKKCNIINTKNGYNIIEVKEPITTLLQQNINFNYYINTFTELPCKRVY